MQTIHYFRRSKLVLATKRFAHALTGRKYRAPISSGATDVQVGNTSEYKVATSSIETQIGIASTDAPVGITSTDAQVGIISTDSQVGIASTSADFEITSHLSRSATSDDTNSPVQFDDKLVYALSSIRHMYAPTAPKVTDNQIRKHLSLVDGIALLLVTQENADVAAVSFLRNSTSIDFYYAKNRPCTRKETYYIESILNVIRNEDLSKTECARRI